MNLKKSDKRVLNDDERDIGWDYDVGDDLYLSLTIGSILDVHQLEMGKSDSSSLPMEKTQEWWIFKLVNLKL